SLICSEPAHPLVITPKTAILIENMDYHFWGLFYEIVTLFLQAICAFCMCHTGHEYAYACCRIKYESA
ncbi:MAG TPA: hypothetical protein VI521_00790, partial [Candidatus Babeliales bacterium]|nr:hypothetical protein [Candidatus Babeliales bacterium]